jgi:hypothetical protein
MSNRRGATKASDTPTTVSVASVTAEPTVLTPDILALIDKAVSTALEKLTVQLNDTVIKRIELQESLQHDMAAELKNINAELLKRDQRINALENICQQQQNVIARQVKQLDNLEIYSKADNIIINGLPEQYSEAVAPGNVEGTPNLTGESSSRSESVFTEFCRNKLHVEIQPCDIVACHRIPKSHRMTQRPMVVRFANRRIKMEVLAAKKRLALPENRNEKIYINEHLTKQVSSLFSSARQLVKNKKLDGAWTRNGRLFVKSVPSQGSKIMSIDSSADLEKF